MPPVESAGPGTVASAAATGDSTAVGLGSDKVLVEVVVLVDAVAALVASLVLGCVCPTHPPTAVSTANRPTTARGLMLGAPPPRDRR